jgi:hypothetical protein
VSNDKSFPRIISIPLLVSREVKTDVCIIYSMTIRENREEIQMKRRIEVYQQLTNDDDDGDHALAG